MDFFYEQKAEDKAMIFFKKKTNIGADAHFHGALELLFVKEGEFSVVVDGEEKIMRANDACFVDSFLLHRYEWGHKGLGYVILTDREALKDIFSSLGGNPPTFFQFEDFELLERLFMLCSQKYNSEETRFKVFYSAQNILLSAISQKVPFSVVAPKRDTVLVCNVLKYAEENITSDLSLQAMAKIFGYSYGHLSRVLHMYLFENWNTYVNRLRVRKVHTLLRQRGKSGLSILQLALDCGFRSSKTFYRAYKKEFGKEPREDVEK